MSVGVSCQHVMVDSVWGQIDSTCTQNGCHINAAGFPGRIGQGDAGGSQAD